MATSPKNNKPPVSDTTTSGQNKNGPGSPSKEGPSTKYNTAGIATLVADPVYSFASDVSADFKRNVEKVTQDVAKYMDRTLALNAMGGDSEKPFSASRDGEIVHIVYPNLVKEGDLLGGLLTILAAQIPTCVIHQGTSSWSEPEWTSESRAHLSGLISGLYRTPESFAHSSSPSELARVSMWITACSAALSVPGGVADAHGEVLPSAVAGGKSASKYMTKVISGLRSNVSDETITKAIDTLGLLIKMWQRAQAQKALGVLRKCKIGWSTLLFRAAPTTTIKGKRNKPDQTVVRSPPKPSKSPWLSKAERSELGTLFKDDWCRIDRIRDSWVALESEQQHRQFNTFIKDIKSHYEKLNNLSNSVHAKLGKRKHWIERVCEQDKFKPKVKKDESPSFALSDHFFSKKLSTVDFNVKKLFSPLTYLPEEYNPLTTWNNCIPEDASNNRITSADFTFESDGQPFRLWQIWSDMFLPVFTTNSTAAEEPQPAIEKNIFMRLFGLSEET